MDFYILRSIQQQDLSMKHDGIVHECIMVTL
ncbi:hypothetical protein FB480_104310 [Agrobacterium vitis]|nr:hypothetical protein FB480_104310 [Agrobacterium vitis]